MANKRTDKDGNIENSTLTELGIFKNMEKAFWRNNPAKQKRNTLKSLEWFKSYVPRSFNRVAARQLFRDSDLKTDRIIPGRMYFFEYDAKHKDTLPVWDRFPMIFPWDVWRGGEGKFGEPGVMYFIGINLHYLPPRLRFEAMKALMKLRIEKKYRKSTRLQLSWKILKTLSNSPLFKHSVKMYRMDHVKSQFVMIPSASWELAIFLPVAQWQKGSKSDAWRMKK